MTDAELLGIALGVIGIALTVYYGAKALTSASNQKQKGGSNSINIQSGRDTNINNGD
jgi:hypothetical protein